MKYDRQNQRTIAVHLEPIVWGVLLIWWGIRWLLDFLPNGTGLLGTGFILLGLNGIRYLKGVPGRSFTTALGILATALGGLYLVDSIMQLPFELPVFAIMLILIGVMVVASAYKRTEPQNFCCRLNIERRS